ncbi:MAG: hypothetical protein HRT72_05425, partial [Flavobacteriales bacterium]|nr:hypothetical protein [Flavobacteriales bacterium]
GSTTRLRSNGWVTVMRFTDLVFTLNEANDIEAVSDYSGLGFLLNVIPIPSGGSVRGTMVYNRVSDI